MGFSFDSTNKIIELTGAVEGGTTIVDVKDLYSRWKDWILTTGSQYPPAFSVIGGDAIDEANGIYITSYFFLTNGWKIKPGEVNHKVKVTNGILIDGSGGDPFISTNGSYNVLIQYSQPIKTETVNTEGGSGGLTSSESTRLFETATQTDVENSEDNIKKKVVQSNLL